MLRTKFAGPYRDETCSYEVSGYKARTVEEFISEVIEEFPDEWGTIRVANCLPGPYCEFHKGSIVTNTFYWHGKPFKGIVLKEVLGVRANGGYGMMDYSLIVKD